MTIEMEKFVHKKTPVEAVRVTEENMADVAAWVHGQIKDFGSMMLEGSPYQGMYIDMVTVDHLFNPARAMVFVGDWIVCRRNSMLVYKDPAFRENFEPAGRDKTEEVLELLLEYHVLRDGAMNQREFTEATEETAKKIAQLFR